MFKKITRRFYENNILVTSNRANRKRKQSPAHNRKSHLKNDNVHVYSSLNKSVFNNTVGILIGQLVSKRPVYKLKYMRVKCIGTTRYCPKTDG